MFTSNHFLKVKNLLNQNTQEKILKLFFNSAYCLLIFSYSYIVRFSENKFFFNTLGKGSASAVLIDLLYLLKKFLLGQRKNKKFIEKHKCTL